MGLPLALVPAPAEEAEPPLPVPVPAVAAALALCPNTDILRPDGVLKCRGGLCGSAEMVSPPPDPAPEDEAGCERGVAGSGSNSDSSVVTRRFNSTDRDSPLVSVILCEKKPRKKSDTIQQTVINRKTVIFNIREQKLQWIESGFQKKNTIRNERY